MSYDRLAPFYSFLETITFGAALQKARCAPLETPGPTRVLILGDGNGRFLESAARSWPEAHFVNLDASEGMLDQAKMKVGEERVRFLHADVFDGLQQLEEESFDTVVSHFFLDCFTESDLNDLVPEISGKIEKGGVWYISDFVDNNYWQHCALWLMYRIFNVITETTAKSLADRQGILGANGWRSRHLGSWRSGFVTAEIWRRAAEVPIQTEQIRFAPRCPSDLPGDDPVSGIERNPPGRSRRRIPKRD